MISKTQKKCATCHNIRKNLYESRYVILFVFAVLLFLAYVLYSFYHSNSYSNSNNISIKEYFKSDTSNALDNLDETIPTNPNIKFDNNDKNKNELVDKYLYPTEDLESVCMKKYGLYPAYSPLTCNSLGNPFANCMCSDKKGDCKVCYDEIKRMDTGATIVYDYTPAIAEDL